MKQQAIPYFFFLLLGLCQLSTTLLNVKSAWPLCPYNMFNKLQPREQTRWHAELLYEDGHQAEVPLYRLYPVEYFKAARITKRASQLPAQPKREFFRRVLRRLNTEPHPGFDEIYPSPPGGLIGLSLYKRSYDIGEPRNSKIGRKELLQQWIFSKNEVSL